ncbi:MAG: hypothetical protein WBX25_04030 [Rhodomicrobium sp.]
MPRKYIVIALSALALGSGVAYWRATNETDLRIQATTHLAALAQLAAEEEAKDLSQKLGDETRARETAERARKEVQAELYDAKARIQALSARLQGETSDKEAAENARMKAEAEAQGAENAKLKAEAEAQAATERLALVIKAQEAAAKRSQAATRASLDHRRRIAMRRAALLKKKQPVSWQPVPPVRRGNQEAIAATVRP